MATGATRGDASAAADSVHGVSAQATAPVGLLRLTLEQRNANRIFLRIGREVFPIYGDEVRGWSTRADDFRGLGVSSPWVYESVEELFFALVNLTVDPSLRLGS